MFDSTTLRNLQLTEKAILDEIVRICDKYKLQYFLIGGTLLGAVRHKGVIPWDDDLDIAMPRKDYEKFQKICLTELSPEYYLHSIDTDPEYWITRIMKCNKNDKSPYFVNIGSFINFHKQTMPKEKYFPASQAEFEGTMYSVPRDYDYVLKRLYGDYMKLPPVEKRVTHRPNRIEL